MRRSSPYIVLFILCLLFLAPAAAQDSTYHLRDLSLTDYLHGVKDAIGEGNFFCSFDLNSSCRIFRLLLQETLLRYDITDLDYKMLQDFYKIVRLARWEDYAAKFWTEQIVLAWLRETVTDLHSTRHVSLEGFQIYVTPFDADGDGQDEWLLLVDSGERGFKGFLPLRRNADGEFEFIETPLPFERPCCFAEYDIRSWNSVSLIRADDVNSDGKDEIVAFNLASSRYDTNNSGRLFVLGLHDGKMVDLMGEPLQYVETAILADVDPSPPYQTFGHSWQFSSVSGQPELIQIARRNDNLSCTRYETLRFRWYDDRFHLDLTERKVEFEDSFECDLRDAQEAFWAGDFENAVSLYQNILAMEFPDETTNEWMYYYYPRVIYTRVRLALAQALSRDIQGAETTLKNFHLETYNRPFDVLIDNLLKTDRTPFSFCKQAYQYFDVSYPELDTNPIFVDHFINPLYDIPGGANPPSTPLPDPAKSGCDVSQFVENALDGWAKDTDTNPRDYLESAGVQIAESLDGDFNVDGVQDQIIWIVERVEAFVFLSTPDDTYKIERAPIPQPDASVSVFAHQLPDNNYAIISLHTGSWYYSRPQVYAFYCTDRSSDSEPPLFEMWQVTGDEIELSLQVPICEQPFYPQSLFLPDGTLRVGAETISGRGYVTTLYPWDAAAHNFRAPDAIIPTDDPAVYEQSGYDSFGESGDTFLNNLPSEAPDKVLEAIDRRLQKFPDEDGTLYERAVVLDLMGDKEGALAGFIEVYERFPDSVYGRLARLHLE